LFLCVTDKIASKRCFALTTYHVFSDKVECGISAKDAFQVFVKAEEEVFIIKCMKSAMFMAIVNQKCNELLNRFKPNLLGALNIVVIRPV
jgi:hypothetical protein